MRTDQTTTHRIVHLELHTNDQQRASTFYRGLFQWQSEIVRSASLSYLALDLGAGIGGGIIGCGTPRPLWLPYVEVDRIDDATEHARRLGAAVLLQPREGPSGWRSVISSPEGGEVALWESKR